MICQKTYKKTAALPQIHELMIKTLVCHIESSCSFQTKGTSWWQMLIILWILNIMFLKNPSRSNAIIDFLVNNWCYHSWMQTCLLIMWSVSLVSKACGEERCFFLMQISRQREIILKLIKSGQRNVKNFSEIYKYVRLLKMKTVNISCKCLGVCPDLLSLLHIFFLLHT